ncbi:MAG: choice-of-anchor E domain-containing protein [Pseudomonadales bacterium]|nr:choice-of-anchor E domain-containing protein [Pseudomonadales bacterium]
MSKISHTGLRVFAGLLVFIASVGNAAVISETTSFRHNESSSVASRGSAAQSSSDTHYFSLSGFDSSLGVLQGVSLTYDANSRVQGSLSVEDPDTFWEDNVRGYGYVSGTNRLDLVSPNFGLVPTNFESASLGCRDNDGYCFDREVAYDYNFDGLLFATTADTFLDYFVDTTLTLSTFNNAYSRVTSCHDNEDICRVSALSEFWGNVTVTYTYDEIVAEVSEPSTLFLFAAALLAVGGLNRKKRQS